MNIKPLERDHCIYYEDMGYVMPFKLRGKIVALRQFLFTVAIVVGLDEHGYERRFCYESAREAQTALTQWMLSEDEKPSGYIKEKG